MHWGFPTYVRFAQKDEGVKKPLILQISIYHCIITIERKSQCCVLHKPLNQRGIPNKPVHPIVSVAQKNAGLNLE